MSATTSEKKTGPFASEDDVTAARQAPTVPSHSGEPLDTTTAAVQASGTVSEYLSGVMTHLGAHGATLYVPAAYGQARGFLFRHGEAAPIREHETLETAESWSVNAGEWLAELTVASSPIKGSPVFPSQSELSFLVPLIELSPRAEPAGPILPSWLGLRFGADDEQVYARARAGLNRRDDNWSWLARLGASIAGHFAMSGEALLDSLTGFHSRAAFNALLQESIRQRETSGGSLALLMINPDGFRELNEQLGRAAGDSIVNEIAQRLNEAFAGRASLCRHGGVVFTALMVECQRERAEQIAEHVIQTLERPYSDGQTSLAFRVGIACFDANNGDAQGPSIEADVLVRHADQALALAKESDKIRVWDGTAPMASAEPFDRLNGIFTGNPTRDYRHTIVLWETMVAVSSNMTRNELANTVVERIGATLGHTRVRLLLLAGDAWTNEAEYLDRSAESSRISVGETGSETSDETLLARMLDSGQSESQRIDDLDRQSLRTAVPLRVGRSIVGGLLIDTDDASPYSVNPVFLQTLGQQVGLAVDRARLAELEEQRREQERRKLESELNELKRARRENRILSVSPQMDNLLQAAQRVAPTPATVLIIGQSGTGKELLARTIHELSPLRSRPMVTVDCSAISPSLIENELFGHERGAYTGADSRRVGRLAEANGGTLFLDEIGELPLEVQSRFLRFVQERQVTPVGGSRPQKVSVRILAATNRDLAEEVKAGRFRADLFYRLNVVQLRVPSLAERTDDVLFLANHFIELFAEQYGRDVPSLSVGAKTALVSHDWPGNVRELENRILQAVIMTRGNNIREEDLDLVPPVGGRRSRLSPPRSPEPLAPTSTPVDSSWPVSDPLESPPTSFESPQRETDPHDQLEGLFGHLVERALTTQSYKPIGRWLGADTVLAADRLSDGVACHAADLLGLPETTYRRRRKRAVKFDQERDTSDELWAEVRALLPQLIPIAAEDTVDLPRRLERILLKVVLEKIPNNVKRGSAILGVSAPTYRRRVDDLLSEGTA